jgi:hypothetical protein
MLKRVIVTLMVLCLLPAAGVAAQNIDPTPEIPKRETESIKEPIQTAMLCVFGYCISITRRYKAPRLPVAPKPPSTRCCTPPRDGFPR